jgi:hypothetical protein
MIEDGFDARTLANMNVALERVCQRRPDGEDHKVRSTSCAVQRRRCAGTSGFDASNRIVSDRPGTLMSKVSSATRLLLQDSGARFRRDRRSSSDP